MLLLDKSSPLEQSAWREKAGAIAAGAAAGGLLFGVGLAGGGFDLSDRHIAGIAAWLGVIALIVLGGGSSVSIGRPLIGTVSALAGLALLSFGSAIWSGAVEHSVIEGDRVLTYLGIFLAAFLLAPSESRRQRIVEGIALAAAGLLLLGLGSRLLPEVLDVTDATTAGPRLRYPLGYWNAMGALAGFALVLLLWVSREGSGRAIRQIAIAAMPATLLTLYFTYSRGGLLALAIGVACLLALSRDRVWHLVTLAIALLAAAPAILVAQDRNELANGVLGEAAADQGRTVLLVLVACTALALLAAAARSRWESRGGKGTGRLVDLSRNPAVLRGVALIGVLTVAGLAVAIGGRAWDRFSDPDITFPSDPEAHFTELQGAGRYDFWRVSLDAFGERPLLGQGAGTYEFVWEEKRKIDIPVKDAHSLYLESLAELGIVGGALVAALVIGLIAIGTMARRASSGRETEMIAALVAVLVAFAVTAAFDWFWEIAALGAIFFVLGGVLVGVRCAQIASTGPSLATGGSSFAVAVGVLGVAWMSAASLLGPLLVEREITKSQEAASRNDLASAIDHAETARSIEPWAASPHLQLGLVAELQGDDPRAIEEMSDAIQREDRNWLLWYLRSRVRTAVGDTAGARADLERARELNPHAPEVQGQ